jgi:hypothetical protein
MSSLEFIDELPLQLRPVVTDLLFEHVIKTHFPNLPPSVYPSHAAAPAAIAMTAGDSTRPLRARDPSPHVQPAEMAARDASR